MSQYSPNLVLHYPGDNRPRQRAFSLNASMIGWVTVVLLWIAAGWFLYQMRGERLPYKKSAAPEVLPLPI